MLVILCPLIFKIILLIFGCAGSLLVHGFSSSCGRQSSHCGDFPDNSVGKESTYSAGDPGLIPVSGRSPGEGIGYLLECSWVSAGKESTCNAGDLGSVPGLGRSSGEGKGYPLPYSGLENSMDYTVHGVAKSWTQLSDFHSLLLLAAERFCCCYCF